VESGAAWIEITGTCLTLACRAQNAAADESRG